MERLGRFLGAFLSIMLFMGIYGIAEEITLTTYYPAPYGAYNELSVSQIESTNDTTSALNVLSTDDNTLAPVITASAKLRGMLLDSNDDTTSYYILNIRSGPSLTSRLYVRNDGKVGIGSTSPSTALDVNGTIKATAYSAGGTAGCDGTFTDGIGRTVTVQKGIITSILE